MPKLVRIMLLLSGLAALSGCAEPVVATVNSAQLCQSWRHQTVSKDDALTDGTATGIEGSNNARTRWGCQWGRNKVKG